MTRKRFHLDAEYHQFYVWDAGVAPDAPDEYCDGDIVAMVKVAPHVVVLQPLRIDDVPVELEVFGEDPGYDANDWDHIVECSLSLPTGALQVHESTGGPVLDVPSPKGTYRVRLLFDGLASASADESDGQDRYTIALWPGEDLEIRVVKQWRNGGLTPG